MDSPISQILYGQSPFGPGGAAMPQRGPDPLGGVAPSANPSWAAMSSARMAPSVNPALVAQLKDQLDQRQRVEGNGYQQAMLGGGGPLAAALAEMMR